MATMTLLEEPEVRPFHDLGDHGPESSLCYNKSIDASRDYEYPMLRGSTYLDHAGTTLYAKSLVDEFSKDMMGNLLGNPHSASESSQLATRRIDDIRLRILQFSNANPDHFDIVFVANATAGIKLVIEALREQEGGFWFGYHCDSHTSLVGARQTAKSGHYCFESDNEVEDWLSGRKNMASIGEDAAVGLFAYPAQSNMNGCRRPLSWLGRIRSRDLTKSPYIYTLLDAAALVSTSPLDLGDASTAPDFTVLSFNKIFGFPDLGALIVRKEAGSALEHRQYFGGGTAEMVTCMKEQWHIKKQSSLHEQLEDGTLPVHSIIALESALSVHRKLFGSMRKVSSHTEFLAKWTYDKLLTLHHGNGGQVCAIYKDKNSSYDDSRTQGPVVAFNLIDSQGGWVSNAEVEKLANIKNIHIRTGTLCNPGGVANALSLEPWEMKRNFSAGQRCGNEHDIMGGKPTGVIRVSLGAMSNLTDVQTFVHFIEEFFVNRQDAVSRNTMQPSVMLSNFYVESLSIYPIKSCSGWPITHARWDIRLEGLAWDREWCLVHYGTRESLSQKRYPKMALIKPSIDLDHGVLRIQNISPISDGLPPEITVPLSADPTVFSNSEKDFPSSSSRVCGDVVQAKTYASKHISSFFSTMLGTHCTLARFPPSSSPASSARHSKAHLQPHQISTRPSEKLPSVSVPKRPILLSNESPILTISRSSLDVLNADILGRNPNAKPADHAVFRANIVLAQEAAAQNTPRPYVEDTWRSLHITPQQPQNSSAQGKTRGTKLEMLGSCRRCQMVCVDQTTAEKNEEPFSTLAKTRRMGGKVWFGVHGGLAAGLTTGSIAVGDRVRGVAEQEGDS